MLTHAFWDSPYHRLLDPESSLALSHEINCLLSAYYAIKNGYGLISDSRESGVNIMCYLVGYRSILALRTQA